MLRVRWCVCGNNICLPGIFHDSLNMERHTRNQESDSGLIFVFILFTYFRATDLNNKI